MGIVVCLGTPCNFKSLDEEGVLSALSSQLEVYGAAQSPR